MWIGARLHSAEAPESVARPAVPSLPWDFICEVSLFECHGKAALFTSLAPCSAHCYIDTGGQGWQGAGSHTVLAQCFGGWHSVPARPSAGSRKAALRLHCAYDFCFRETE